MSLTLMSTRLAAQLRSIEDELTTSIHRSPSQALDSVASALDEISASLHEVKSVSPLSLDKTGRRTLVLELEQAALCAQSAVADAGPARLRYIGDMIGHVRRARGVFALAS